MAFPIDIETGQLSPSAHKVKETLKAKVKEALKKTGHVVEHGLDDAAEAAVVALMSAGKISVGE